MSKTYKLKIQTAHNDEEMWAYSKGHHEDAAFIAAAKKFGCQKDDDEDEGYQLEEIVRSHMRMVPLHDTTGMQLWPAEQSDRGAFPVTMAVCYWVRPEQGKKGGLCHG